MNPMNMPEITTGSTLASEVTPYSYISQAARYFQWPVASVTQREDPPLPLGSPTPEAAGPQEREDRPSRFRCCASRESTTPTNVPPLRLLCAVGGRRH